jgi:hypothetical protein
VPYIVKASQKERNSATFTAEALTKRDAIAKAVGLRAQGFEVVQISAPDGKPVDETEDD